MAKPVFKKKLIPNLIAVMLGTASMQVVYAAPQAASATPAAQESQTVEVRGIRDTLKKNLAGKRDAQNIVDTVNAEDLGKFPDKNVADSLQRVPGISVDRGWGEGKAIFVRGTDKNLNMTQLNGQAVSSSEWWLNEAQTRSFNYDVLPSEIVGSLNIYKSPSADLDEGSIGGLVIVQTRKPLAFKDQLTLQASVEAVYSKLPGKTDPQLSGLMNWKSDDKTFGVMVAVNKQKRTMRRDGLEFFDDGKYTIVDQNGVSTPAFAAWGGGSAIFRQDRERTTANVALQFKPNRDVDIVMNYMNSDMEMDNNNQNYLWQAGGLADAKGNIRVTNPKFITTSDGTKALVGGILGPKTGVSFEPIYRQSYIKTNVLDLDGTYEGDNWKAHAQVGSTNSQGGSSHDRHFWMEGDTRTQIDMGRDQFGVKYLDINPLDPKALTLKAGDDRIRKMEGKENYAQGDLSFDITGSIIKAVKVGLKYRDNTLQNSRIQGNADPKSPGWQSFSLADLSSGPSPMLSQAAGSQGALTQYAWFDDALVASKGIPMFDKAMKYSDMPSQNYTIKEKITATYVKADYAIDKLRGDFGVRLVKTQQTSSGFSGNATIGYKAITVTNDYSDVLPSLNMVYDLRKDLILRGAISKAMARQTFDLLSPAFTVDGTVLTKATAGNPLLKPVHANQAEFGAEWYFSDASMLSATAFVKQLDTFTYKSDKPEVVDGKNYTVTRPQNADNGADIKGFEVQWQQAFGNTGFGAVFNYTFTDAKAGSVSGAPGLKVLGNSRDQFNASAYYEKDGISTRLSYNYRSESFGGQTMGGQVVNSAYGQWDATASYDVTPKISIFATAVNITNALVRSNTTDGLPLGVYENGARYSIGVRAKF